jgi:hypothetical protein
MLQQASLVREIILKVPSFTELINYSREPFTWGLVILTVHLPWRVSLRRGSQLAEI